MDEEGVERPENDPERGERAPMAAEASNALPATESSALDRPLAPPNAYWIDDREPDQDDVALRALEHMLEDLRGEDGDELLEEANEPMNDFRSFGREQAWAPQRASGDPFAQSASAPTNPRPWEFPQDRGPSFPEARTHAEREGDDSRDGSKARTLIREVVETGLLALLVFLSVKATFQNFKVDGGSMFPTLEDGQFLIVNKLVYSEVDVEKLSNFVPFVEPGDAPKRYVFHGPERGDIVVLKDPRVPEQDLIKRVVGLPGESIEIKDGHVYINNYLLNEPYIKAEWQDNKSKVLIPPGQYFVMGDNRGNSKDSRSSQVGFIPKDLIIGKATLSYWPKHKFGLAPNEPGSTDKPSITTTRITESSRAQAEDSPDTAAVSKP